MKFLALCSSDNDNVANTFDEIPVGQKVEISNKKKVIINLLSLTYKLFFNN